MSVDEQNTEEIELVQDADDNRRAHPRRSVLWPAKMEVRSVLWPAKVYVGLHEFSCQISNFSLGGAKVRMDLPLKEGTSVILSIPNRGDIPAAIAWVGEGSIGLEFSVNVQTVREMFKDRLGILGLES